MSGAMRGYFLRDTSAISTCRSPSCFARCSNASNGCGITFAAIPDDQVLEISQLGRARDLSRVRSSRVKAGLVDGPPLARPVIVHGNQEPVGLFFGQ
jgi:hypothetical protein